MSEQHPKSPDGRYWWDGERWQLTVAGQAEAEQGARRVKNSRLLTVLVLIAAAAIAGYFVWRQMYGPDSLDCGTQRFENSQTGEPVPDRCN